MQPKQRLNETERALRVGLSGGRLRRPVQCPTRMPIQSDIAAAALCKASAQSDLRTYPRAPRRAYNSWQTGTKLAALACLPFRSLSEVQQWHKSVPK